MTNNIDKIEELLAAPFPPGEILFRPGATNGARALALPYISSRHVQDRLDSVLGISGWQDEYDCLPDGSVICWLRLRLQGEWITKTDVGSPSEQPDEGDRRKAAFSDALKRAAVKFGIGRFLYRLPPIWCDWDQQKKRFAKPPQLPGDSAPADERRDVSPPASHAPASSTTYTNLPADGEELRQRLYAYDTRLAIQGLCQRGDLIKHVITAGVKAGHSPELHTWTGPALVLAVEETKSFEAACCKKPKAAPPASAPAIPAATPAPANGAPDPAEIIGGKEKRELLGLMKAASRTWAQCAAFLRLDPQIGLGDLSFAEYGRLREELQRLERTAQA